MSTYEPPKYVGPPEMGTPEANGLYDVLGKICQVDMNFWNGTKNDKNNRIEMNDNRGATITIVDPFINFLLAIIPKDIDFMNCGRLYYQTNKSFFFK